MEKRVVNGKDADKTKAELLVELNAARGQVSRLKDVIRRYERVAERRDVYRSLYSLEVKRDSVESLLAGLWEKQMEVDLRDEELEVLEEELRVQLEEVNAKDDVITRQALMLASVSDAIIGLDLGYRVIYWSHSAEKMYGYTAEEVMGRSSLEVFKSEYMGVERETPNGSTSSSLTAEVIHSNKDGCRIIVESRTQPLCGRDGKPYGSICINRDVTERRRAERALCRHNAVLNGVNCILAEALSSDPVERLGEMLLSVAEDVTGSMFGFIGELSPDGRLDDLAISEPGWEACQMANPAGHRIAPMGFETRGLYSRVIRDGKSLFTNDPPSHPDSIGMPSVHPQINSFLGVPLVDQGRVVGMVGLGNKEHGYSEEDVLAIEALVPSMIEALSRKRAGEALRESEGKLRSFIASSVDGILLFDREGLILESNRGCESITGMPREAIVGRYIWDVQFELIVPERRDTITRETLKHGIRSMLASDDPECWKHSDERTILSLDGQLRTIQMNSFPVGTSAGRLAGTIIRDITEKKRIESELVDSKQQTELYLDLMGHDINNMHQVALGYLEMARDWPEDGEQNEFIDKSVEVLQRSTQLIDNVRKLRKIHEGAFNYKDINVCRLLADVQSEYEKVAGKTVTLNLNGHDDCRARANELLHDVFANLVNNAVKHTGNGTEVIVNLDVVNNNGGHYCRIAIEDNGPGVPDDFKERVFNRMHKGTARGMGLGLYIVKTLVDNYDGKVWVENRIKGDHTKGARFVVMLPVVENP
ncbi:MAG TPA: PAS domain S-box protein [Methanocella sp.]|nr:PAS domain S-box protein [Methanocella sp.]